jgi:hypothetical protein
MTVRCSWCVSPYRQVAEEAIAVGEAVMAVARRYGLSRDQWRHHKDHASVTSPAVTSLAAVRLEVLEGGGGPYTVIPRLEQLVLEVQAAKSKWVEKPQAVLGFMRLERDLLGDVAKLRGEFPEKRSISVGELTEWRIVLDALGDYPRALRAVSVALQDGDVS